MDFQLSKMHLLQQELFRKFAETEIRPLAKEMDEKEAYDLDLLAKMQRCVCFVVTGYRPSVFRIPHMLPSWSPSACPEALRSPCPLPQRTLPSPHTTCPDCTRVR